MALQRSCTPPRTLHHEVRLGALRGCITPLLAQCPPWSGTTIIRRCKTVHGYPHKGSTCWLIQQIKRHARWKLLRRLIVHCNARLPLHINHRLKAS